MRTARSVAEEKGWHCRGRVSGVSVNFRADSRRLPRGRCASERKTQQSPAILFLGRRLWTKIKVSSDDIRTSHAAAGDGGDFGHQSPPHPLGPAAVPVLAARRKQLIMFRELLC